MAKAFLWRFWLDPVLKLPHADQKASLASAASKAFLEARNEFRGALDVLEVTVQKLNVQVRAQA